MMKTILLVDDCKVIIAQLAQFIKRDIKDVNILVAYSYKEAVKQMLQNSKIHLAILDLNLPDAEDGEIVNFAIGKNIPSIVLTGLMDDKLKKFILEKDIVDYFNKQHLKSFEQLTSVIDRNLKNYDKNVLVVDDSPTHLSMALDILKNMHINTKSAKDGFEALEIIENSDEIFDLILTDYNMPNMDGMELTMKVREKYKKDKLGIIVLSANDQPEIATDFLKIGANDFIHKPYNKIEFSTRINLNLEILDLFEQTRDLANKDFLTGSYNRRFFFESGNAIFSKAKRDGGILTVAMFDIDKFKNINDTYGHDVGDVAIQEIARILKDNLRNSDLIARFGGEEFCALLENIELEDVKILFEKIRVAFEKNILKVEEIELSFTVSTGVCYGMESSLEEMIKKADTQLYHCKENGRNRVEIYESFFLTMK